MSTNEPPPPFGKDSAAWAEDVSDYMARQKTRLAFKGANDSAVNDGNLIWDTAGYPVVSKNGQFRQIVLADGHADFIVSQDVSYSASSPSTPVSQKLTFSVPSGSQNENINLINSGTGIEFDRPGHYLLSFSAQVSSENSSSSAFVFWPKINGADSPGTTMHVNLKSQSETTIVSRTALFTVSASDYLEVWTACDSASGKLKAFGTVVADEPTAPAATLSIIRVHQ